MMKCGIGQDSHRFEPPDSSKPLIMGGVLIPNCPGLQGNSDADVILHALTNAISGITGENVIGAVADKMCRGGTTDSREYLKRALESLHNGRIAHVSLSIEGARPKLAPFITAMKQSIAHLLSITPADVGITATSGEGLSSFGRGEGIQALAVVTVWLVPTPGSEPFSQADRFV